MIPDVYFTEKILDNIFNQAKGFIKRQGFFTGLIEISTTKT